MTYQEANPYSRKEFDRSEGAPKEVLKEYLDKHATPALEEALLQFIDGLKTELPLELQSKYSVWYGAEYDSPTKVIMVLFVALSTNQRLSSRQRDVLRDLERAFHQSLDRLSSDQLAVDLDFIVTQEHASISDLEAEVEQNIEDSAFTPIGGISLE